MHSGRMYVVAVLFCSTQMMGATVRVNQLNKIFHHKGDAKDVSQLELGKLVFYFAHAPKLDIIPVSRAADRERRIFFFPYTNVKADKVEKMIDALNSLSGSQYNIRIETVDKPVKGVRLTLSYDPAKIGMSYDTFDSISRQKGIVFHFYNKEILEQLRTKGKPILRTAARTPTHAVVIDCGHGGIDAGTMSGNGICEKNVTLQVGAKLAELLRTQGVRVFLTRQTDATVALDQRTSMANTSNADAFISIHANASLQKHTNGIETYCIVPSLLTQRFSTLGSSDNQLVRQWHHDTYQESNVLAQKVHDSLLSGARGYNNSVRDLHVKHAIPQVLLGTTTMPATLVEIGFLSHEQEAALLSRSLYQHVIARGICNGVMAFLQSS